MLEIEVKFWITNIDAIKQVLIEKGVVFDEIEYQKDTIFVEKGDSVAEFYQNKVFCRIRKKGNGKLILTVKKKQENFASLEYESEIMNESSVTEMLKIFGFSFVLEVEKNRLEGKYKDYTFCLDDITNLGLFLEVEKLVADDADIIRVKQELRDLVAAWNIEFEEEVVDAYDTSILKKQLG